VLAAVLTNSANRATASTNLISVKIHAASQIIAHQLYSRIKEDVMVSLVCLGRNASHLRALMGYALEMIA
jgi:hypothetical protein